MTTIQRRPKKTASAPAKVDIKALVEAFTAFRRAKNTEATSKKEAERLRDEDLMPALIKHGHVHGEQGKHLAIELPEPIDGFTRLVRRANTSRLLDVEAAETLLEKKGVLEQAQQATLIVSGVPAEKLEEFRRAIEKAKLETFGSVAVDVQFSQERMMAYHQQNRDKLTEKELDSLIIEETTYSFFPEKS